MIHHVHQALAQVRAMHHHVIEKQRFKGYSGRARAFSGCCALVAAAWLAWRPSHGDRFALVVWIGVALVSIVLNYGAVVMWFLSDPQVGRQARRLKPVIEVVPALAVGGILTLAFWRDGAFIYLPPVWMLLFGVANLASRHVLPKGIGWVGLYYMIAGTALLFAVPHQGLSNPWSVGLVFFSGEWLGGLVLHFDGPEHPTLESFLGLPSVRTHHDKA
jgi:hypothetical protein